MGSETRASCEQEEEEGVKQPDIFSHTPAVGQIKGGGGEGFFHWSVRLLQVEKVEDALDRWLFRTLRCTL